MVIIFDMDNTLTDELGATARPWIVPLLRRLRGDGHRLILWTHSPGDRARVILRDHGLREFFDSCVFREDYDPEGEGRPKDLRRVGGDFIVDDDPDQIAFARSIHKKGYCISAYRRGGGNPAELQNVYKAIRRASGWLGRWFG